MPLVLTVILLLGQSGESHLPPPGDGLALLPGPPPAARGPVAPGGGRSVPLPALPTAAGLAGAAAWGLRYRRVVRTAPPSDLLVVFVGGYGSPEGPGPFEDLVGLLDLSDEQVRSFDYRWSLPGGHTGVTRIAEVEDLAAALQAYLTGLAESGRPIYLVGHSKGGAVLAELVADWDDDAGLRIPAVRGAALLDPPLADGPLGWLQSVGGVVGLPNDGGYDPRRGLGWEDRRVRLGEEAGVEVVVFRNPKAAVTNFAGRPEGLRVFDVPDEGPHALGELARPGLVPGDRWIRFQRRVRQAHEAVLRDPRVAACIAAEMAEAGSCRLP